MDLNMIIETVLYLYMVFRRMFLSSSNRVKCSLVLELLNLSSLEKWVSVGELTFSYFTGRGTRGRI